MIMTKTRVIIVDDSASIRDLFSSLLSSDPSLEVVATAEDPFDAREKIKRLNPDVITLDVEMPKMDGISFLEKIMTLRPMPVIMASTLTSRGAETTLRALEIGAIDYITKPGLSDAASVQRFRDDLIRKVKCAADAGSRIQPRLRRQAVLNIPGFTAPNTRHLIAIGASTGGVEAIREILIRLPANVPPVVITQHMPEVFTASFAARMDGMCAMTVQEAAEGLPILPGNAYIAAGNYHLEVAQKSDRLTCCLSAGPLVSGHRPSVDVMFRSLAAIKNKKVVAAILTGMGHDGAAGLLALRQAGFRTLGQTEASCTVYGMPKAARQMGAVEKECSLADMAHELLAQCNG